MTTFIDMKPFDLGAAKSGALIVHMDEPKTPLHFLAINHTLDYVVCETRTDNIVQVRHTCDIKMFPRKMVKYGVMNRATHMLYGGGLCDVPQDTWGPGQASVTVTWEE